MYLNYSFNMSFSITLRKHTKSKETRNNEIHFILVIIVLFLKLLQYSAFLKGLNGEIQLNIIQCRDSCSCILEIKNSVFCARLKNHSKAIWNLGIPKVSIEEPKTLNNC